MTDKRFSGVFCLLAIPPLLASCGVPQSELDAANSKIAELEASIKQLQADKGAVANTPAPDKQGHVKEQTSAWIYQKQEDKMTGGKTYTASIISSNSVSFSFPYTGLQNGKVDPEFETLI